LIPEAHKLTRTGHPHLDRRWESDGPDKRNSHYRRKYYHYAYLFAKKFQPEVVVELGIDEGDCCGHWAAGNPTTQVYGIDVHKDSERPSELCREVERNFPNFHYLRGWTWDRVKDIKALNKPVDVLFIDSWHTLDYLARDWNDYHVFLKKGSVVLVDDLNMGLMPVFEKLPGQKFVDNTLAISIGIAVYDGSPCVIPFQKQDFMP